MDHVVVYLGRAFWPDDAAPKKPVSGRLGAAYLFLSGPQAAFAWFVAGIPFDITHGVGNFFVCLALFKPLDYLLERMEHARVE